MFSKSSRAVALLLCVLMVTLPALPQSPQTAGKISALIPATSKNSQPVHPSDAVLWNDLLKTDTAGRARVGLRDGSILSLGSNAQLRVVQHDATTQQTSLQLEYGKMRSQVVHLTKNGSKFEVRTPTAVIGVIGTDFFVDAQPGRTIVLCFKGKVTVSSIAGAATATSITPGQMTEVGEQGPGPAQPTPKDLANQAMADTAVQAVGSAVAAGHQLRWFLIAAGAVGAAAAILPTQLGGGPTQRGIKGQGGTAPR